MGKVNALARLEQELEWRSRREGGRALKRWSQRSVLLAAAPIGIPSAVPRWVWTLDASEANGVLGVLVAFAQEGDELAFLALLACLRPGICALAADLRIPVDEVVSETAIVVAGFPLARRSSVAGQVLLDARGALHRRRQRAEALPIAVARIDPEELAEPVEASGWASWPANLVQAVAVAVRAGDVSRDAARLILETRVLGEPMAEAAQRRGLTRTAAYQRRTRAEERLEW